MERKEDSLRAAEIRTEWSRRHEVRAESFLHAIPDLMFLIDRDGTYVDFQPTKDIQPYVPPSEFLGRRVLDVLPENVARPCQYLIGQALSNRQMQSIEYQLPVHGGLCEYEARIVPSTADEVLVVVRELSSRDVVFLARRQAEAQFRTMFETFLDAVAVVHSETLVYVNPALAVLFGYQLPEILTGRSVLDLISGESRIRVERWMRSRAGGRPVPPSCCAPGLRSDGSTFEMDIHESEHEHDGKVYTVIRFAEKHRASAAFALHAGETDPQSSHMHDAIGASRQASPRPEKGYRQSHTLGTVPTARELQVLSLIAIGYSTKQVAAALGIAYKTADAHRSHLMEKLGVHETASMVRYAIRIGLIEP